MVTQVKHELITERSYWLDVLRGLAIFGVVAVHSIQLTDNIVLQNKSNFFSWLIGLGQYGVELFFFCRGGYSSQFTGEVKNSAMITGRDE